MDCPRESYEWFALLRLQRAFWVSNVKYAFVVASVWTVRSESSLLPRRTLDANG
jgi:hypothetical protein